MWVANWLINAIQTHNQTLIKLAQSVFKFQDEFFDDSVSHLMPITLRHLAEDIHMLESTVSHAMAKQRVYTPQSLFELTHFFQNAGSTSAGRLSCVKA